MYRDGETIVFRGAIRVSFYQALLSGIGESELARLRRLRRAAIYLILAYFPVGLLFSVIGAPRTGTLVLMEVLVLVLVTLWHLRLAECPKCDQPFYANSQWGRTSWSLPFGSECMHCDFTLKKD